MLSTYYKQLIINRIVTMNIEAITKYILYLVVYYVRLIKTNRLFRSKIGPALMMVNMNLIQR